MDNKILEYLLNNDPDQVLSKNGVQLRKLINPLFRKVMMLFTSGKLEIVKRTDVPKDKKIIYACTHGFHDDIIFSMKTANRHAYLLYGSLMDFFKSFHGLGLWVNGVVLVNRKDKESRKSSVAKMQKALELGANIIMFPEGTWNKNEGISVQKLYPGIYDVAEKTGALVVPIATVLYDDKAYSIQGDAYDITKINDETAIEILGLQLEKILKVHDMLIYSKNGENRIKIILQNLLTVLTNKSKSDINKIIKDEYPDYLSQFNQLNNILENKDIKDLSNDLKIELIDSVSSILSEIIKEIDNIRDKEEFEKDSIYDSVLVRSKKVLKTASEQKKLTAVSILRDKMSTLKWEIYKNGKRSEFDQNYWDNYVEGLIKTTNGLYDHEIEDVAEYKDPTEISETEVFDVLDNVNITNKNAKVLMMTKNK